MEKKESPSYYASVVVINSDGKVLLGKRKEDGIWTSPGGGAEPGEENPAKTAVRELFEEAGLPANEAFLQPILPAVPTRNGKLCHVFLYVCGTTCQTSSKLDPDQEVKTWKWFSIDEIPNGLRDDERRFKSVRDAYMKFYGMRKSLVNNLEKGGKPAQVGEIRDFGGTQYQKMADGSWKPYVHPEEKQLQAEESKNKVESLTSKLKEKIAEKKDVSHSEKHLSDLESQVVIEGKETRSGKPMFTNVDAALAHGYEAQDFREVGSLFYDRAQKMAENIKRLQDTKQKVDPSFEKIKSKNMNLSRQFVNQANRINDRKVKKSTVAVGHNDAAEIETSSYSIDRKNAMETEWLERVTKIMDGYNFGDEPRVVALDQGDLYLVRVDGGIYSGVFKTRTEVEGGVMEDNAKVRIERMTLPSLITFCLAKEWIESFKDLEPVVQAGMRYSSGMDYYAGQLEAMDRPQPIKDTSIDHVQPTQPTTMDQKIQMLSLLDKLIN